MITLLFLIFLLWLFAMCLGAVLGTAAGVGKWLMGLTGYNAWWERMKEKRSPENVAKRDAAFERFIQSNASGNASSKEPTVNTPNDTPSNTPSNTTVSK